MCDPTDRHTIWLIIFVDDKPVSQGQVVGDDLDAMLLCAYIMKQRAMVAADEVGAAIDRMRKRYDAEEAAAEEGETDAPDSD